MTARSEQINANLTKGSASSGDVLQLLRMWRSDEEAAAFRQRVVDGNLLGKTSRSRIEDIVDRVLLNRYAPDGDSRVAHHLSLLAKQGVSREILDRLLYYHAALAEHLLYVVATELVYAMRSGGHVRIGTPDVQRFLARLHEEGRAPSYSDSVAEKLGQAALTTLRDFGILEGRVKKRIAVPRVPAEVSGYLCYALHEQGLSAKRVLTHTDWRLFLLHPPEVEGAVLSAADRGFFMYRSAGDIRRFDFTHDSLEGYVHALAQQAHR